MTFVTYRISPDIKKNIVNVPTEFLSDVFKIFWFQIQSKGVSQNSNQNKCIIPNTTKVFFFSFLIVTITRLYYFWWQNLQLLAHNSFDGEPIWFFATDFVT